MNVIEHEMVMRGRLIENRVGRRRNWGITEPVYVMRGKLEALK